MPMTDQRRHTGCLPTLFGLLVFLALAAVLVIALLGRTPVRETLWGMGIPIAEIVSGVLPGVVDTGPKIEAKDIVEEGLAFQNLSDGQKIVYKQLLDGVNSLEESFQVWVEEVNDIEPAYHAIMVDHPELFWVDGSTSSRYYASGGPVTVTPGLLVPLDEVPSMRDQLETVADSFVSSIPEGADDYTKAKMAYEYIIGTTDYDVMADHNQNIQSVLLGHVSVCAGYARAYQYLLQKCGVFCSFVEGTIPSRGEDHAWNIVRMNGEYTFVDVTWGDPTYLGLNNGNVGIVYDYLGLTTNEILRDDHVFVNRDMWPVADSIDNSYYYREGLLFDTADEGVLSASLYAQLADGRYPVVFKFADEASYVAARNRLAEGEFLLDAIREVLASRGTLASGYQYTCSDSLYILKLFL